MPDTDITVRFGIEKNFQNERWRVLQGTAEARGERRVQVRCVTWDYERIRGVLPENTLF